MAKIETTKIPMKSIKDTVWHSYNKVSSTNAKNLLGTKDFEDSETTLYDTIMLDICHYIFVKTHTMYTTKMNLNVSCELLVVVMCQCRSIICNKCTSLLWTLTVREVMWWWWGGGKDYMGYLCTSLLILL